MNKAYDQVREFQKAFGQPVGDQPSIMQSSDNDGLFILARKGMELVTSNLKAVHISDNSNRVALRSALLTEEIAEFMDARNITDQVDAMIDVIYIALGTLVEMGVRPEAIFNIVHDANMAKLGPNGKPIVEYGKVRKPEGWQKPEPLIEQEIERQSQLLH